MRAAASHGAGGQAAQPVLWLSAAYVTRALCGGSRCSACGGEGPRARQRNGTGHKVGLGGFVPSPSPSPRTHREGKGTASRSFRAIEVAVTVSLHLSGGQGSKTKRMKTERFSGFPL